MHFCTREIWRKTLSVVEERGHFEGRTRDSEEANIRDSSYRATRRSVSSRSLQRPRSRTGPSPNGFGSAPAIPLGTNTQATMMRATLTARDHQDDHSA